MNKFLDDEKFLESPFQLTLEDFQRLEVLKENISEEEGTPRLIKRIKPCFYLLIKRGVPSSSEIFSFNTSNL
jgi:hypothetical protein